MRDGKNLFIWLFCMAMIFFVMIILESLLEVPDL